MNIPLEVGYPTLKATFYIDSIAGSIFNSDKWQELDDKCLFIYMIKMVETGKLYTVETYFSEN